MSDYAHAFFKHLILSMPLQLSIVTSMAMSPVKDVSDLGKQLLITKLEEYHQMGTPLKIPPYVLSLLLYVLNTEREIFVG